VARRCPRGGAGRFANGRARRRGAARGRGLSGGGVCAAPSPGAGGGPGFRLRGRGPPPLPVRAPPACCVTVPGPSPRGRGSPSRRALPGEGGGPPAARRRRARGCAAWRGPGRARGRRRAGGPRSGVICIALPPARVGIGRRRRGVARGRAHCRLPASEQPASRSRRRRGRAPRAARERGRSRAAAGARGPGRGHWPRGWLLPVLGLVPRLARAAPATGHPRPPPAPPERVTPSPLAGPPFP
jgi:hypothetical protein